tara:strand:+ start:298 stop:603 length:306 start_codon:yes stop_codon:yes gene_type:complete
MRYIFDDDVKDKPFSFFVKRSPNIVKACQIDDDFKVYREGEGVTITGNAGDYIILGPLEGFYVIEKNTFEKYYKPYFIFEAKDNILSLNEHIAKKAIEYDQ